MEDLRTRLIRLAHARPDLRDRLLPLIKEARAQAAPSQLAPAKAAPPAAPGGGGGGDAAPSNGGGKVIQGPWADKGKEDAPKEDKAEAKPEGDAAPKAKKRKDLASTPEAAEKLFKKYKEKNKGTKKTVDDFLDEDAAAARQEKEQADGTDGDTGGTPQESAAPPQAAPGSGKSNQPYKPNIVDTKSDEVRGTPTQRRQETEQASIDKLNKKYEKKRDENGDLPPEIQKKMDAEHSTTMERHDKHEKGEEKAKIRTEKADLKKEKEKFTEARKEQDKADRDTHSDSVLEKLKAKHGDDKVAIADAHDKAMKKYDDKAKKKKDRKDKGALKTFLETYKKFKNVTKTWLNPESNPIIQEVKNAGTIRLSNVDAGIKARVTDRYMSRPVSSSRVASRFLDNERYAHIGPPMQVGSAAEIKKQGLIPVDVFFGEARPHRRTILDLGDMVQDRRGNLFFFAGIEEDGTAILGKTEAEAERKHRDIVERRKHHTYPSRQATLKW